MAKVQGLKTDSSKEGVKQAYAVLRYAHISPRKTRLIADLIRGKDVADAVTQLQVLPARAARPVLKLLLSAVANAENNFKLNKEHLRISKITVDQGPVSKRYLPSAYGRASLIRRPTSHINIIVSEVVHVVTKKRRSVFPNILKRAKKVKAVKGEAEPAEAGVQEEKTTEPEERERIEGKGTKKGAKRFGGFRKTLFNRRGGEK